MIYREHVRGLINYGYKVTSDRRIIEDSIQDLFVELWTHRQRLSETTSVRFYLFKALRYKIVRNVREEGADLLDHFYQADTEDSHEHQLIALEIQSQQTAHLRDLIANLPARQREAINLRYYHNFSNEEIAEIMGVNYQSACKFIYTGLKNLKKNLEVSVM